MVHGHQMASPWLVLITFDYKGHIQEVPFVKAIKGNLLDERPSCSNVLEEEPMRIPGNDKFIHDSITCPSIYAVLVLFQFLKFGF